MQARVSRDGVPVWIAILLLAFSLSGYGWDAGGHEIVATVAWDRLNPKARAESQRLSAEIQGDARPYDPITISCWMDDLRSRDSQIPYHGLFLPWHYIDIGLGSSDPLPDLEPGRDSATTGNCVTALKRALAVLRGGTDPYIPSPAVAYALAVHLVGDIHQPLHAAAYFYETGGGRWKNDRGGNNVMIVNGPATEAKFNLHYFWDDAWRASFDPTTGTVAIDPSDENNFHHDGRTVRPLADQWEISDKPADGVTLDPDFVAWARESNLLARDDAYGRLTFTENHRVARLSAEYVAMANLLARQRLVLAGYRLAALLNATIGAPAAGN